MPNTNTHIHTIHTYIQYTHIHKHRYTTNGVCTAFSNGVCSVSIARLTVRVRIGHLFVCHYPRRCVVNLVETNTQTQMSKHAAAPAPATPEDPTAVSKHTRRGLRRSRSTIGILEVSFTGCDAQHAVNENGKMKKKNKFAFFIDAKPFVYSS